MPEGIEIELYRRAAEVAEGRTIRRVDLVDADYARGGVSERELRTALEGERLGTPRRRGKLLLLDVGELTLGLRFGMTGRLLIDGRAAIDQLEYASRRDDPAWDRFRLRFAEGGSLTIRDQRRLGNVELAPAEDALGVDLFEVTGSDLGPVLRASSRPLKARLMDQAQIAGLGNLLCDEVLWRAGLDPRRAADSLNTAEQRRLLHHLRRVPAQLMARGGSHLGDLQDERHADGRCPRDGAALRKHTVGGRTTYACPEHQR